jgi:tRNA threonylcarbamoyladenosine biosynthesis protein TsaB
MTILALETATDTCSVALWADGGVVADAHLHRPRIHAQRLTPLVEDLLDHGGVAVDALDAVAVSEGPGSYTGLRIGVSTAKGWALATGAALVGVPTLEAWAAQGTPWADAGDTLCALIDARRDEVYAAAYRLRAGGELDAVADVTARSVDTLPDWLGPVDGTLWCVGDGASKSREALTAHADGPVRLLPPDLVPPSAAWGARRAAPRLDAGETEDVATFEPFYLKDFHGTPSPSPL